jgi:hypothetical protein
MLLNKILSYLLSPVDSLSRRCLPVHPHPHTRTHEMPGYWFLDAIFLIRRAAPLHLTPTQLHSIAHIVTYTPRLHRFFYWIVALAKRKGKNDH